MRGSTILKCICVFAFMVKSVSASTINKEDAVYTQDKLSISVSANQPEFTIKLKSNPTTGYSWFLKSYSEKLIQPVKYVFQAPQDKKLMGAPGYELWTFRAKPDAFVVPQQTSLSFAYARPWETDVNSQPLVFTVNTKAEHPVH